MIRFFYKNTTLCGDFSLHIFCHINIRKSKYLYNFCFSLMGKHFFVQESFGCKYAIILVYKLYGHLAQLVRATGS